MQLRKIIRKLSVVDYLMKQGYYGMRRLIETHMLGTKVQEWLWSRRKFYFCENHDSLKAFSESVHHAHRAILIKSIISYAPIESILEVGCNSGPNLYLLSSYYPDAKLYGVDINANAVAEGIRQLQREGIKNVFISHGKADALKNFSDKSCDIIFTDAVLMYIGPDKIDSFLSEAVRIARKAVIFCEWHMDNTIIGLEDEYKYHYGHWIYNFRKLCGRYVPQDRVRISKLPTGVWNDVKWTEFGAIIEIKL